MNSPAPSPGFSITHASQILKFLRDEHRLRILLALAEQGELDVSTLCTMVAQSQPSVSASLALMRLGGVVTYRRQGKHNLYRLHSQRVRDLLRMAVCRTEAQTVPWPE
jgi:ArsR family transcriptional regulator